MFNLNGTGSRVFVSELSTHAILEMPIGLQSYKRLTPPPNLRCPQGLAVDGMDTLLVCDSNHNSVVHIDPSDGRLFSRTRSAGPHRFESPLNVAVVRDGILAVLDRTAKLHFIK